MPLGVFLKLIFIFVTIITVICDQLVNITDAVKKPLTFRSAGAKVSGLSKQVKVPASTRLYTL